MLHFSKETSSKTDVSYGLPFNLTRYFTWVFLVIMFVSSLLLAFVIGNNTASTLVESQKKSSLLMAENLNKQLFRNFIAPRMLASQLGLQVSSEDQYATMDELVQMLANGMEIEAIRIYDPEFNLTYATATNDDNTYDFYSSAVAQVVSTGTHCFDIISNASYLKALVLGQAAGTYYLRTTYQLTIDTTFIPTLEIALGPLNIVEDEILGVLEITRDITNNYYTALRSQRLIILGFLTACGVIFLLIQVMAKQAERILSERVRQNLALEASLHQSEKLASMGRVVASIAHEIRNPLGIIRSSSELLLNREQNHDQNSKAILEAIYGETCRLSVTVNDFLDYAKPRNPHLQSINLRDLLQQVISFQAGEMVKRQTTLVLHEFGDINIVCDADLLYRALYNVLINAQQAIQSQGVIELFISTDNRYVKISVQDTGPGFADDNFTHPLDPFYTSKEDGTGLGLPIVNSIVTVHGGWLELHNAVPHGAIIDIFLPILEMRSSDND